MLINILESKTDDRIREIKALSQDLTFDYVINTMKKNGIHIDSLNNDFILTLFNLNYSANVPQDVTDNVTDVTDNVTDVVDNENANIDKYIIKMIRANPKISTSKIAEDLNVSKRTILRHIDELKKKNKLRFVGEAKNGYWELI